MSDYFIGLTGGIASGKSEVTRRFEALGIVVERSHCPHCKTPLSWYENIPLFSWLAMQDAHDLWVARQHVDLDRVGRLDLAAA